MDEQLVSLIQQTPNLAIAIAALWWQARTIQRLIEVQIDLIERFTRLVANGATVQQGKKEL